MAAGGKGRLAGKVALITGAGSGIGKEVAGLFAAEGARVVASDINEITAGATAGGIGGDALAFQHDVTSEDDWIRVVDEVESACGGLHILVNNAGVGLMGTVEEISLADWQRLHNIDLDSVFLGCKYALPKMRASGGGSIVNLSSIAGIIAAPNMAAYNSAKAAVRHLSKSVALQGARSTPPVRCNSVHPAFIDTPILDPMAVNLPREEVLAKLGRQIPLGRVGKPIEVANAILFLASDESSFITGAELKVDGGISAM